MEVPQYKTAKYLGPTGSSKCPSCGNSLQNGIPIDRPDLRRCADCKVIFIPSPNERNK